MSNPPVAQMSLDDVLSRRSTVEYDSDDQGTVNDDVSESEVDRILNFALRTILGVELSALRPGRRRELCRGYTFRYAETLARVVENMADSPGADHYLSDPGTTAHGGDGLHGGEVGRSETTSRKRKQDDFDAQLHQGSGEGVEIAMASAPAKRMRPSLRIRCPYRARNQLRFNVRDHHGCAMTYFTSIADVR